MCCLNCLIILVGFPKTSELLIYLLQFCFHLFSVAVSNTKSYKHANKKIFKRNKQYAYKSKQWNAYKVAGSLKENGTNMIKF